MYIQKCLTLEYTAQVLNIFNLHSFSNVGLQLKFLFVCFNYNKKGIYEPQMSQAYKRFQEIETQNPWQLKCI